MQDASSVKPYHFRALVEIAKILLRSGDIAGVTLIVSSHLAAVRHPRVGEQLIELLAQMESGVVDLLKLDQIIAPLF